MVPDVFAIDLHLPRPNHPLRRGRKGFQFGSQLPLQQRPGPMEPDFDCPFGNAQRGRGFSHVHLFDVPEQHNVTVNRRQALDGLAQQGAEFLAFQGFRGDFAPTGEDGRREVAGVLLGFGFNGVFAACGQLAQPAEALVAGDGEHPSAELRVAAEEMKIEIDLDDSLLGGIFGIGFIFEQRKEEEVDGPLAGADQLVEELLLAGQNAANALGFEFGVGCLHDSLRGVPTLLLDPGSGRQRNYILPWGERVGCAWRSGVGISFSN